MAQERLSELALISIESEYAIFLDIDKIVEDFVTKKERRFLGNF